MWKQKLIGKVAEVMVKKIDSTPPIAPPIEDVTKARIALITTAGVHLNNQPVFDVEAGDSSYRIIPDDTPTADLVISHTHYDRSDADIDINCVFPFDRLHELKEEKEIGTTAAMHFGFMGYIPKTEVLIEKSIPEVVNLLKQDAVDIVILSPG